MKAGKNRIFLWGVSLIVTVGLIWLLLRQISLGTLVQTLANIDLLGLVAFAFFSLSGALLRAWRYKRLLNPSPIGWRDILLVTFIRNLFVDLLPARLGSLSYVYILNKRLQFAFEAAASSFLVSFIYDFITLGLFLLLAILKVGVGSTALSSSIMVVLAGLFFLLAALILWKIKALVRFFTSLVRFILNLTGLESRPWAQQAVGKLELTVRVLKSVRSPLEHARLLLLSLGIRAAKYLSLYTLLLALLKSHGLGFQDNSLWVTILGITGAEMTGALPIKGLGGFGTWETGWAFTFKLLNFEPRLAVLTGLGVHLITNLFEYLLGLLSLGSLYVPVILNSFRPAPSRRSDS